MRKIMIKKLSRMDSHTAKCVLVFLLFFLVYTAMQPTCLALNASDSAKNVHIYLDENLVTFVKGAIWVGGIFLAIFTFIGVAFFGWDVRKARNSIAEIQKEMVQSIKEIRSDIISMKEMKEEFEELGAQLEETMDNYKIQIPSPEDMPTPGASQSGGFGTLFMDTDTKIESKQSRSDLNIIKEVISSSNYKWTTIGRIVKKTGLDKDSILREARSSSDIEIGFGKSTQDYILRFKEKAQ